MDKMRYWISPDGDIYEATVENQALKIAEIFCVPYQKQSSFLYYRIAFENNFIRIFSDNGKMKVQLTKPAKKKQKQAILLLLQGRKPIFISYNYYETEVYSEEKLQEVISGKIDEQLVA